MDAVHPGGRARTGCGAPRREGGRARLDAVHPGGRARTSCSAPRSILPRREGGLELVAVHPGAFSPGGREG